VFLTNSLGKFIPSFPKSLNKNPRRLRWEAYGDRERSARLPFRRSALSVFPAVAEARGKAMPE